jgi:hypothetical protein
VTTAVGRIFTGTLGREVVVLTAAALTGGVGVGAGATTGSGGAEITVSGVAEVTPFGVATLVARTSGVPPRPSTNQMPTPLRTTVTTTPSA